MRGLVVREDKEVGKEVREDIKRTHTEKRYNDSRLGVKEIMEDVKEKEQERGGDIRRGGIMTCEGIWEEPKEDVWEDIYMFNTTIFAGFHFSILTKRIKLK